MRKRDFIFGLSTIAFISCSLLLITGSAILTKPVFNIDSLPAGTLVAWAGILFLVLSIRFGTRYFLLPEGKVDQLLDLVWKVLMILAIAWGFIGYLLADNWSFTFTQQNNFRGSTSASVYFWNYTYALIILPFLLLLVYLARIAYWKCKKASK